MSFVAFFEVFEETVKKTEVHLLPSFLLIHFSVKT